MTNETEKLIKDALELCGTRYELEAGYKHRLLSELAHALRRAETARDAALRQSAAREIQAQDMRDRLVKAEAERDAQHEQVLRLTGERDALVFQGAEVEHAMLLAADERDEFAAALDKARAQVWGLICVATNCAVKADESFPILRQVLNQRDELTATRDLLTEENARLQKEHNAYVQRLSADALQVASKYQRDLDEARAQVATLELLQRGGK